MNDFRTINKYSFVEAAAEVESLIAACVPGADYLGVSGARSGGEGIGVEFIDSECRGDDFLEEVKVFLSNFRDTELWVVPGVGDGPLHVCVTIWDYGL